MPPWRGALVAAILGTGLACAGKPPAAPPQPPAPVDAREYYPLDVGWRWAYDVQRGRENILAIYAVRKREAGEAVLEAGNETIVYEVTPAGIARATPSSEAQKREGAADFLLRSPVAPGARWPITEGWAAVVAVGQTVDVPAGKFANCITIEETRAGPRRLVRTTYAPGVGPVTIESQVESPEQGRYETTLRAALRGFTRPGQNPLE